MARDEFRCVLEAVEESVQLAQDVVGDVARGLGFAVKIDRYVGVATADLLDEFAQVQHRRVEFRPGGEFLVVDGEYERGRARLLLRELGKVAVARDAQYLDAFI